MRFVMGVKHQNRLYEMVEAISLSGPLANCSTAQVELSRPPESTYDRPCTKG
jgi:hypothetical protein